MTRHPLPSTGSLGSVPPLLRYNEVLGLLVVHPASLRFLRSAVPSFDGADEISQVPGEPSAHVPRSPTPVGPPRSFEPFGLAALLFLWRWCLPRLRRRRRPPRSPFGAQSRGPYARCLRFAATVTRAPRKTRFRLVVHLGRSGFAPAGSLREVSAASSTWHPPHPGFAWRTSSRG
jgi:hypothetical protein